MTITNTSTRSKVSAMFTKVAMTAVAVAAVVLTVPAKANAQVSFGLHVGVPVYTQGYAAYPPTYGYYDNGRERHEEWERRQAFLQHEQHEQWERQQAYERAREYDRRRDFYGDRRRFEHDDRDRHFDRDDR